MDPTSSHWNVFIKEGLLPNVLSFSNRDETKVSRKNFNDCTQQTATRLRRGQSNPTRSPQCDDQCDLIGDVVTPSNNSVSESAITNFNPLSLSRTLDNENDGHIAYPSKLTMDHAVEQFGVIRARVSKNHKQQADRNLFIVAMHIPRTTIKSIQSLLQLQPSREYFVRLQNMLSICFFSAPFIDCLHPKDENGATYFSIYLQNRIIFNGMTVMTTAL